MRVVLREGCVISYLMSYTFSQISEKWSCAKRQGLSIFVLVRFANVIGESWRESAKVLWISVGHQILAQTENQELSVTLFRCCMKVL